MLKKSSRTDGNAYFVGMLGSIPVSKRIGPREILDSIGQGLEEVAVVKCHGGDHSKTQSKLFFLCQLFLFCAHAKFETETLPL